MLVMILVESLGVGFGVAHLGQQYGSTDIILALSTKLLDPALVYDLGQVVAG